MKTYEGVVVFRYYANVKVAVEDGTPEEEIRRLLIDEFDQQKAEGECEVYDLEEVTYG